MQSIVGVFEGGGIKGIALAGAAAAAMDAGYHIEAAVGTSAGALVGSLVAAGYTSAELRSSVCRLPWPDLLDASLLSRLPGLGKHLGMVLHRGIYRGEVLERTWEELLAAKGVRTFADIPVGALRMVATDLTHTRGVVLPDALPSYGSDPTEFPIARAVHMSAAVPFVFRPVKLVNRLTGETALMADGAMASKFPVQLADFEGPLPVVGFRLVDPGTTHPHMKIRGPVSLAAAVISSGVGARESLPLLCTDLGRVVEVPSARDPLDFDLAPEEARAMFDGGYAAGMAFFQATQVPERP